VVSPRTGTATSPAADSLAPEVERFAALRAAALASAVEFGTPQYLLDVRTLRARADALKSGMQGLGQPAAVLYAYKANYLLRVVRELTARGLGAEVGGLPELELALAVGAQTITLNGPAMSVDEMDLALAHGERVLIQIDNATEVAALRARLSARAGAGAGASGRAGADGPAGAAPARWPVGLRLRPPRVARTPWSRFGVAADEVGAFLPGMRAAGLDLVGLHIHGGPVPSPAHYRTLLDEILPPLDAALTGEEKARLRLLNLGGGLVPERESLPRSPISYAPGEAASSQLGGIRYAEGAAEPPAIDDYLRGLASALDAARRRYPWVAPLTIALEPGRFLVAKSMHLLMRVYTVKDGMAILDGSTSLVGYDRFGTERFPVLNLTRPGGRAPIQSSCYGSLCDPGDFLGEDLYGEPPAEGDLLAFMNQGAYSLSYAHRFMRPTGRAVALEPDGTLTLEKDLEPLATWLGQDPARQGGV
jgi:diaminopimelate decarboxylase